MRKGVSTLVLLAALVAWGCRSAPATRYYMLELPSASSASVDVSAPRVVVEELAVQAPYDRDRIAYRPDGRSAEIGFYQYHRWALPLGEAVSRLLADELRRQAGLDAVAGQDEAADLVVEGVVRRIEEIDEPGAISVEVEVELEWSRPGEDRVGSGVFVGRSAVEDRSVVAVAEAAAQAVREIAGRLAAELPDR